MARQEKQYHYIYKITCNVTNRYYIGMHSTDNMNDGYFGSGKRLWFSINYHGKENHVKEILEWLPSRQLLKEREKEIVNKELLGDVLCMNLVLGGEGGYISQEGCKKGGNSTKLIADYSALGKKGGVNRFIKHGIVANFKCDWNGKTHSDKTKQLMSEQRKGNGIGKTNSQYGTCWITKEGVNKKIKKETLESFINEGWVKGRN